MSRGQVNFSRRGSIYNPVIRGKNKTAGVFRTDGSEKHEANTAIRGAKIGKRKVVSKLFVS